MRANQVEDSTVYYESDYQYDGRGQLVRERILRWDSSAEMMVVTQDVETTYDLGRNPTQVKFSDDKGWAYTETRTYAKGYQLTDCSLQTAAGVTGTATGSYTYDTNNNLTGTKKVTVFRAGPPIVQLAYRESWTFTFDRKNRLKTHTHGATDDVSYLWWDGAGRVWQRWDYDSGIEAWKDTLTRYIYDGALSQEHLFDVSSPMGEWIYTYSRLTHDYLRQPAGIRDRVHPAQGADTDYFLLGDMGTVSGRFTRGSTVSLEKAQRVVSGDRQSRYSGEGAEPTGSPFTDVSNLGFASTYIESYGGTKTGNAQFFDALNQFGSRHYLPGLGRYITPAGNNRYVDPSGELPGVPYGSGDSGGSSSAPGGVGWAALGVGISATGVCDAAGRLRPVRRIPVAQRTPRRGGTLWTAPSLVQAGWAARRRPECNCFDCASFLAQHCDGGTSMSWFNICRCAGGMGCSLSEPDPCAGLGYSCADLVCGRVSETGTPTPETWEKCVCPWLTVVSTNVDISEAWQVCSYCLDDGCGPQDFVGDKLDIGLYNAMLNCELGDVGPLCYPEALPDELHAIEIRDPDLLAAICCNLSYLEDPERFCELLKKLLEILIGGIPDVGDFDPAEITVKCCECLLDQLKGQITSQCTALLNN